MNLLYKRGYNNDYFNKYIDDYKNETYPILIGFTDEFGEGNRGEPFFLKYNHNNNQIKNILEIEELIKYRFNNGKIGEINIY